MKTPLLHPSLHLLAKQGDLPALRRLLHQQRAEKTLDLEAYDFYGYTPLMQAVRSPLASVDMVWFLVEQGANIHQKSQDGKSVLVLALKGGDPEKVSLLVENGANIHYRREGYDALLDAVHYDRETSEEALMVLLKRLLKYGVALNTVSSYQESALRTLSRCGWFRAVQLLLEAGADAAQLQWTPLHRAIALGTSAEVEQEITNGADLEARDWSARTAWLLAVQVGDISKTQLLLERGADFTACGRCEKPALFFAIEGKQPQMLRWLLDLGFSAEQTDEYGTTPLRTAVECNNVEAVDILLQAGAAVDHLDNEYTVLSEARTQAMVKRLLEAGADPSQLTYSGQRALLGFPPELRDALLRVSPQAFHAGWERRFGTRNPEKIENPFWEGMIQSGMSAAWAATLFGAPSMREFAPIWCADRFGQSLTILPDGRIVQVGGEHEDWYDLHFCIYNDVFVHHPDGTIQIYGYPSEVFPPTDFHTATLLGDYIYLIGRLGYFSDRDYDITPVYRLHTQTFCMEPVLTRGESPGRIYKHQALLLNDHEIRVFGGKIVPMPGEREAAENKNSFLLDVRRRVWRKE